MRETKDQAGIKWMRAHALPGCYSAGIRLHAYPKGSDRSLMDTERIDLCRVTGTQDISLPGTHTHTHTPRCTDIYILYMTTHWRCAYCMRMYLPWPARAHTIYSCSQPHTSVQRKNKHCAVKSMHSGFEHTCKESAMLSNTSWLPEGLI